MSSQHKQLTKNTSMKTPHPAQSDIDVIRSFAEQAEARARVIAANDPPAGTRADLLNELKGSIWPEWEYQDLLPISADSHMVWSLDIDGSIADLVVFHPDGSATSVVVVAGDDGLDAIACGVRETLRLARALHLKTALPVHAALLWSSLGDIESDAAVDALCPGWGVIPIPLPALSLLLSVKRACQELTR